jgi:hypothetical protein
MGLFFVRSTAIYSNFQTLGSSPPIAINFFGHKSTTAKQTDLKAPANLPAYQEALRGFIEKKKPLLLPHWANFPIHGRDVLLKSLQTFSPTQLTALRQSGFFGIGEEAGDALYYLTLKAAHTSGVLSPEKFSGFYASVKPYLGVGTPVQYQKVVDLAHQAVSDQDVNVLAQFFPAEIHQATQGISPTSPQHPLRRMLAMYLSDFAIATEYREGATTLADLKALNGKLQEELGELIEHFETQKGSNYEGIPKIQQFIDGIPSQASQIQEAIGTVLGECRKLFSTQGLSLKNVLDFSAYKSECRTEFILRFPTVAYNDMKQQAKAWEKLFEVYLLQ